LSDSPDHEKTKADDASPFPLAFSLPDGVSFGQSVEAFTTLTPDAKAAHLQGDIE
jgi:hypothetical protein